MNFTGHYRSVAILANYWYFGVTLAVLTEYVYSSKLNYRSLRPLFCLNAGLSPRVIFSDNSSTIMV